MRKRRENEVSPAYITVDDALRIIGATRRVVEHWVARDTDQFATRCVIRRGGRLWIDVQALHEWIDEGRAR